MDIRHQPRGLRRPSRQEHLLLAISAGILLSALAAILALIAIPLASAHGLDYTPSGSPYNFTDGAPDGWTLATTTTVGTVNTTYHRLVGDGTGNFDAASPTYSPLATVTGGTLTFCNGGPYAVSSSNTTVNLKVGSTNYAGTLTNSTSSLPTQCSNIGTDHLATVTWSNLNIASGASVQAEIISTPVSSGGVFIGNISILLTTSSATPTATPTGTPTTGGGASGNITYPTIDLVSISTAMNSFWNMIFPIVAWTAGISLAAYVAHRVKSIFF